jgi:hypothetical protein
MNRMQQFEHLAQHARLEPVPTLDVAPRVLATLRDMEPAATSLPMFAVAGLSLAAASVMVAWAVNSLLSIADPLGSLFQPLALVLL